MEIHAENIKVAELSLRGNHRLMENIREMV